MIAMTRSLTKHELSLVAKPFAATLGHPTRHDAFVPQFLIVAMLVYITFGAIVSLASVWLVTSLAYAPTLVA
jgi:hypothetical protein